MGLPQTLKGWTRYLPHLFFAAIGLITVLALMPAPAIPQVFQFWDKAQHALAYAVLAAAGYAAFPTRTGRVALGLLAHGALIEVLQGTLTTTRYADLTDWIADGVGVLLCMLLARRVAALFANRIKTGG